MRAQVASYFALAPASGWERIMALDITGAGSDAVASAQSLNPMKVMAMWIQSRVGDPLFIVRANKVD